VGKSDKNFSFNDLCYVLEHAGFQSRSGRGSHRIYYKEGVCLGEAERAGLWAISPDQSDEILTLALEKDFGLLIDLSANPQRN
jgi:hypothetical protein